MRVEVQEVEHRIYKVYEAEVGVILRKSSPIGSYLIKVARMSTVSSDIQDALFVPRYRANWT